MKNEVIAAEPQPQPQSHHAQPNPLTHPSEREQAQENQYIRKREEELLKAAREKLKAAQAEVDKHTDNLLQASKEQK